MARALYGHGNEPVPRISPSVREWMSAFGSIAEIVRTGHDVAFSCYGRELLIGAAASLLCGPAIVRVGSLMPLRGIIFPIQRNYYGFLERLFVHIYLPPITKLQNTGLSAHGIAAEHNRRGSKTTDGRAWGRTTCDVSECNASGGISIRCAASRPTNLRWPDAS